LLVDQVDLLRESVRYVKSRRPLLLWLGIPYQIISHVCLAVGREGDNDFSPAMAIDQDVVYKKLKRDNTIVKMSVWQGPFFGNMRFRNDERIESAILIIVI